MTGFSELDRLRAAITDMDSLSQHGFSQIASVARLALLAMETPEAARNPDRLADAFELIWTIAEDVQNCINARAEELGCNYIDPAAHRRQAARAQCQRVEVSHGA